MAFIPVPDTVEVRMQYSYDGQQVENVFHVHQDGEWTVSQMQAIATVFVDLFDDELDTFAAATLTLNRVLVRDLTTSSGLAIEWTTGLPLSGLSPSPQLPNNVTAAVKWTTGLAGRSFRGRTYHLGLCENSVTANELVSTLPADLESAYATLITNIPAAVTGAALVVVSKYHLGAPRTTGITTDIIAVSVDPVVDSQRRRLPGRGA